MAEYANREKDFAKTLPDVTKAWMLGNAAGYIAVQDALVARYMTLLSKDADQVEVDFGMKFPDGTDYSATISVPPIILMGSKQYVPTDGNLTMDMSVSATSKDDIKTDTKIGLKAGGSAGWGPFKASVELTGDTAVNTNKQRDSDYRATTHSEVTMGLIDGPEGLARIQDALNKLVDAGIKLAVPDNPAPDNPNPNPNPPDSGGGDNNVTITEPEIVAFDNGDDEEIVIITINNLMEAA